jgi:hypothetical protein
MRQLNPDGSYTDLGPAETYRKWQKAPKYYRDQVTANMVDALNGRKYASTEWQVMQAAVKARREAARLEGIEKAKQRAIALGIWKED